MIDLGFFLRKNVIPSFLVAQNFLKKYLKLYIFFLLKIYRDFELNFLGIAAIGIYSNIHFLCKILLCTKPVLENVPQNRDNFLT